MNEVVPKRLHWRCRRGTKELDQLLDGWLTRCYSRADMAMQEAFDRLLDEQDPQLWDWLIGRAKPVDPYFAMIADEIRAQHKL